MIQKILITIIFFSTNLLFGQSQFQEFLKRVNSLSDPAEKTAVIDSFMSVARQQGIPFIEDSTANFIYLGNPNTISIAGDFNGWNPNINFMSNLSQTNFWYFSKEFELNARLDYKFVLNGNNWILDPENPHTVTGGYGPNSELAMPEYIQPWEIVYNPDISHGTIVTSSIFSNHLNATYKLKIYLPPGYESSAVNYPSVYFQDGFEYISLASADNIIDNLLDSNKIKPIIAVFVKPNNRNEEYAFDKRNQYRLFFVEELVPFIDSVYRTIDEPGERMVMGDSYGGNISALISYNHADIFGLCGLHSGAFQPNNFEAYNLIVNGSKKDIKWSSVWGSYEGSLAQNMRHFRDQLISKGYEFQALELPEGHSWGLWRANIDRFLEYFFPAEPSTVDDGELLLPGDFKLYQNYPNPFNPTTTIRFTISDLRFTILKVYDLLGKEVAILVNRELSAGKYDVEFNGGNQPSGVLFYQLIAGNYTETKKMILLR